MDDDVKYSAIFEWNMTRDEAEIYKLAVIYEEEFKKMFDDQPDIDKSMFRPNTITKKSDPRKSNVFRYCWKLRRETRGLLEFQDYRHYIRANLTVLQAHKTNISPQMICGDKAWIRWKVWKRIFDRKMAEIASTPPPPSVSTTDPKLIREIDRTKKYLFERCEGSPTCEKIKEFIDNGFMKIWVMTSKVCPYYVVLSPFVAKSCDVSKLAESCAFDPALIKEMITQQVKDYFAHEFTHEC